MSYKLFLERGLTFHCFFANSTVRPCILQLGYASWWSSYSRALHADSWASAYWGAEFHVFISVFVPMNWRFVACLQQFCIICSLLLSTLRGRIQRIWYVLDSWPHNPYITTVWWSRVERTSLEAWDGIVEIDEFVVCFYLRNFYKRKWLLEVLCTTVCSSSQLAVTNS